MPKHAHEVPAFRKALQAAGFTAPYAPTIYNDLHKGGATRRVKLWFADGIFDASIAKQRRLEKQLKKEFGSRILSMYFIHRADYYLAQQCGTGKSLCILLSN
jgi:hypothetical protein